ncbi:ABC transporter substrate-binding protein [Amycolatopsis sp. FU40]|uniref:ABC transporter substrate-binding protein n=1 Tax=Amycolatopsis sp. FU40 TaxID=2914159 RepID=UPI001F18D3A7|nr:ABC transporter substrate-binding protein [Amycolatopsis sp. FU40]UKD57697.1 ABC transporter substrate-binding protein [Amycolatopsis sp. FU40]
MPGPFPAGMSRRQALRLGALGAGGLLLAGCGGAPPVRTAAAPTGPRKRGGTFRFAPLSTAGTTSADPLSINSGYELRFAMFDSLVVPDHQNRVQMSLAELLEPEGTDQSVWTIRLREGVEFHNGKTLDADDVLFSLQRILDPKTPSSASNLLKAIDLNAVKKLDKRTLRLKLTTPNSQLRRAFAPSEAAIMPVGFDPNRPVGTGPFKQVNFTPGQRWTGTRNGNYWREGRPYLDGLEFIGFADTTTARTNALISGQVDGIDGLHPAQLPQISAHPNLSVLISQSGAYQVFEMRCDKGAVFEDPRVRKAFKLLVDRPQMIKVAWNGQGAVGNDTGVWAEFDPAMDGSLPQHAQDLDQARSLLKAAGKDGMSVTLRTCQLATGQVESANVLVQNAKAAGVTVNLDVVANRAQYYGGQDYYTSQFKVDSDSTETMFANLAYVFTGKGIYNNTGYDNPKVNSLYAQALAATPEKYQELMHEVSRIVWDDGPWISWGRQNTVHAFSNKFTGAVEDASGRFNGYQWGDISVA